MRLSKLIGLENSTSRVFDCRDADAPCVVSIWPVWLRIIFCRSSQERLWCGIEEKAAPAGVKEGRVVAVAVPEGEAPWLVRYVSVRNAAKKCRIAGVCPAPERSVRRVVLLWSENFPHRSLFHNHLSGRCPTHSGLKRNHTCPGAYDSGRREPAFTRLPCFPRLGLLQPSLVSLAQP